jgi:hypothetical protein
LDKLFDDEDDEPLDFNEEEEEEGEISEDDTRRLSSKQQRFAPLSDGSDYSGPEDDLDDFIVRDIEDEDDERPRNRIKKKSRANAIQIAQELGISTEYV